MKKTAPLWKGIALALVLLAPGLAVAASTATAETASSEASAAATVPMAPEAVETVAVESAAELDAFTSALFWMQGSADLEPVRAEQIDSAALAENGCFPPSPPPPSCVCGSCCECNKCWQNGILVKMPCGSF